MPLINLCCACKKGGVIPFYQNVTKVRPPGDTLGPHYTAAPYLRYNIGTYGDSGDICASGISPAGTCGDWLAVGDLNGLSDQEINDTVNDIMTCGSTLSDHNCYSASGTVDTTTKKPFGGAWVYATKYWHGALGIVDADDPAIINGVTFNSDGSFTWAYTNLTNTPGQTRYRTITLEADLTTEFNHYVSGPDTTYVGNATISATVGQYTGITTKSGSESYDTDPNGALTRTLASEQFAFVNRDFNSLIQALASFGDTGAYPDGHFVIVSSTVGQFWSGTTPDFLVCEIGINVGAGTAYRNQPPPPGSEDYINESLTISNTEATYVYKQFSHDGDEMLDETDTWTSTVTYSDGYDAGACYDDWIAAFAEWDLSDFTLQNLRSDSQLALGPLIVYDEVGPSSPAPDFTYTMDDLSATQNMDGSWPQRTWLDPLNYVWVYPNGSVSTAPGGFTGGATLVTPMRTGAIVSHNPAGYDRHFWFDYTSQERDSTDLGYEWFTTGVGGFSNMALPTVTMRWMNNDVAQYDAEAYRGEGEGPAPEGNYPQAWYKQNGQVITGGKYVQVTQQWDSVNYGRPCGPDRFVVDQLSVCCITGGSAPSFTVVAQQSGYGIAPLASGGLQVNDYIASAGDGIYKITGISGSGPWTVTVGSKLDDLPTGFQMSTAGGSSVIGRLRWPTAPGICGRVAITAAYSSPTLTITPGAAQPWLRAGGGGTLSVDLYDATMTLLANAVTLTCVSDSSFTTTAGDYSTAAYMVWHSVDWTKYDSSSKRTGVFIDWAFNQRQAQSGYPSPPTWYAGVGGCLSASVTQFNYGGGPCPAVVGIVPSTSPEDFGTGQVLYDFPDPISVEFDSVYGSHWQAAIFLTMPDPFYQEPFKPGCNATTFAWAEDNGTGEADAEDGSTLYFPHHPLVEASSVIPSGDSLPSGVTLFFDPDYNAIAPPYYSGGIPIGDITGDYASIETDWSFALNVCNNPGARFNGYYLTFVKCALVPT